MSSNDFESMVLGGKTNAALLCPSVGMYEEYMHKSRNLASLEKVV